MGVGGAYKVETCCWYTNNMFLFFFTTFYKYPSRPDDRRVALVALWPQSRSEAETKGADWRTNYTLDASPYTLVTARSKP